MRPSPPGRGSAASRMMAVRTDVASRRMPRTRRVPPCSRTKRSSASCSRCSARSPVPFGTTCSTATCAPKRLPRSRARRMASSACGPPRTGTRIERTSSTPRCLTTAMSHGDSRTTASMVGEKTAGPSRRAPARGLRPCGRGRRRRAAPAEDDEVRSLLPHRLDHAVGGPSPDPDHGPDLDALLVAEVKHALQQAARGASLGGALRQGDALRHLHDAERGDLGGAAVADPRADADQVARRARVGQRQQDAVRRAAAGRHQRSVDAAARISFQRVTR